jgi:hypothetical protein
MLRYGFIWEWDTPQVTDVSNLYEDQRLFNDDISTWDISNVTDKSIMFSGASIFNQPIGGWQFKMSQICQICFTEQGGSTNDWENGMFAM